MANQHTSRGRTEVYQIRFTPDEWEAVRTRAESAHTTVADVIRAALGFTEPEQLDAREGTPQGD